jgi:hypothetical protein
VTAAVEVRRARRRRAEAFSENPSELELPSIHTGEWEPFFVACNDTLTVITAVRYFGAFVSDPNGLVPTPAISGQDSEASDDTNGGASQSWPPITLGGHDRTGSTLPS